MSAISERLASARAAAHDSQPTSDPLEAPASYDPLDAETPFIPEESTPTFEQVQQDFAETSEPTSESLSPTADRIDAVATRISGFLRNRAETKQKTADQEDAFASYEDNIQTTKDRERQERKDAAIATMKGIGRSALARLKNAGMITLGAGLIAGEAGNRGVKQAKAATIEGAKTAGQTIKTNAEFAYAAAKSEASQAAQATGEKITDTWNKAEELAGKAGAKLENGIETGINKAKAGAELVKDTVSATKESIGYMKERYLRRKEAALTRKYERHARWTSLKREAKAMAETYTRSKQAKRIGQAALNQGLFDR